MDIPNLPSRKQFATRYQFDEDATVEAFYGKTIDEAQALFADNFLWYCEQLSVIAHRPFNFYVVAATNYLRSPESTNDPDSVSGFCHMIEHRLSRPSLGLPIDAIPNIRATIDVILQDFDRYDADVAIYGPLRERYRVLACRLAA